jgi:hypothetical protein
MKLPLWPSHSGGERAAQRARRRVERVEATRKRRDDAAVAQRDVLVLPVQLGGVNRLWFLATPGSRRYRVVSRLMARPQSRWRRMLIRKGR